MPTKMQQMLHECWVCCPAIVAILVPFPSRSQEVRAGTAGKNGWFICMGKDPEGRSEPVMKRRKGPIREHFDDRKLSGTIDH